MEAQVGIITTLLASVLECYEPAEDGITLQVCLCIDAMRTGCRLDSKYTVTRDVIDHGPHAAPSILDGPRRLLEIASAFRCRCFRRAGNQA